MRWLLLMLAACGYSPTAATDTDATSIDNATVDMPTSDLCFGSFETVCLKALPTTNFTLGGGNNSFDTGQVSNCAETTDGTTVTGCVIAATEISIDGMLTATGPRPLILVATTGAITIPSGNLLDVASHRGAKAGAGGNPTGLCGGGTAATGMAGGAGGSLVGRGGTGGTENGAGAGTPNPAAVPTTLRGGCPGGLGGSAPGALGFGDGGGALLLIAGSIAVDGAINASGGGGDGGVGDSSPSINRGGYGGGSGGMVVFDTASLSITGTVMAQGGGGGEGASTTLNASGDIGDDPTTVGTAAKGGSGGTGNNGGDGGVDLDGENGDNGTANGGGGGGGTGLILFVGSASTGNGQLKPPPMSR